MAWASRSGRARTSASHPEAFGVCQRCGIWYNRNRLRNQMEWRGATILPTWLFVCDRCYDTPQEQNRAWVPPADPIPVQLALPEDFSVANSLMGQTLPQTEVIYMGEADLATYMTTTDGAYMAEDRPGDVPQVDPITNIPISPRTAMRTVDGVLMSPTPVGRPPGYDALDRAPVTPNDVVGFMAKVGLPLMAQADGTYMATEQQGAPPGAPVPPLPDDGNNPPVQYGAPLPIVSLIADGTPLVRATCNAPHGLALNSQVLVRGSLNALADGVFSVIPITATAFTYGTYSPVDPGSILGPETIIVTALIGLPRDYPAVPQTGLPQSRPTKTSQ